MTRLLARVEDGPRSLPCAGEEDDRLGAMAGPARPPAGSAALGWDKPLQPGTPPRRCDPGLVYWASAAALACAVAAPFPFFWVPPLWVLLLLAPPPPWTAFALGAARRAGPEPLRRKPGKESPGAQTGSATMPEAGAARVHVTQQGGVETSTPT